MDFDFTGFTFGDYHSDSEGLNIVRVSDGDRYNENLFPEVKDLTAEVPGMDGEYYFGSTYGTRTFEINIAFDSLTEEQFRQLRRAFGTKNLKQLIFDERPYKKYIAKIESPIELSFVCFDEPKKVSTKKENAINGVRRDRDNDSIETVETEITESFVVRPSIGTYRYQFAYTPLEGSITITSNSESLEQVYIDSTVLVLRNNSEEDIEVTITYSYVLETFVPAWEQVTPWVYEEGTQRIYKGDGTISLICYYPFAKSAYKVLPYAFELTKDTEIKAGKVYFVKEEAPKIQYVPVDDPDVEHIDTYYEKVTNEECKDWAVSSGMKSANDYDYSKIDKYDDGSFKVYNPGDIETGFRLYCPFNLLPLETSHTIPANSENDIFSIPDSKYVCLSITSNSELKYTYTIDKDLNQIVFSNLNDQDIEVTISYFTYTEYANLSLVYRLNNETISQLYFNSDTIEPIGEDDGFLIDTNNQLIIGVINFNIDTSDNATYSTTGNIYNQYVDGGQFFKIQPDINIGEIEVTNGNAGMEICYDYLYF